MDAEVSVLALVHLSPLVIVCMRVFTVFCLLVLCTSAFSQTPGTCELGVAEGDLDVNDVFARVFNTGALFFGNETTAGNGYLVPKASGNSPLFAMAFGIGGMVNGELKTAASRYTRREFWPGPLNDGAALPNSADCTPYDRIFVVSRDDVRRYIQTREATNDLRDWPADLGAPVLDGDGIEGNYNLEGGDQPAIYGDQMAWWVMNDVGNAHEETLSNPLGVEVQVSAFAVGTGIRALKQATFYRYRIINRSSSVIDSAYVMFFMDADLGDATDDWAGSDTTLSMGYTYNSDSNDSVYGIPPAHGYQIVQGPVGLPNGRDDDDNGVIDEAGERLRATAVSCYGKFVNPEANDPRFASEYYNCMQGRWLYGTPMTASGLGYQTDGPITVFAFPADPVENECWTMANDCEGSSVGGYDIRLYVSSGPFRLSPGQSEEVVFALPFGQGSDNLDSVTQLRFAAFATRGAWESGILDPQRVEGEFQPGAFQLQVSPPFPNPFTDQTTIRYELSEAMVARIVVYDALGREVAVLADGEQPAGSYEVVFNGADLAPGTYVVRFEAAGEERAFTMIKLR